MSTTIPTSSDDLYDEMFASTGKPRNTYKDFLEWFEAQNPRGLKNKHRETSKIFRDSGITFRSTKSPLKDQLIPFDWIPRIISSSEWRFIERGVIQRALAINAFVRDVYHKQEILRAKKIPSELVTSNPAFLPLMMNMSTPSNVYAHIIGSDIVRTGPKQFYVLEDNARTPSGASYMIENRDAMLDLFPDLFSIIKVKPVENYPDLLLTALKSVSPQNDRKAVVCVLTPGPYNAAYYEHAFLADRMGVELAEGSDLRVIDGKVNIRSIRGYTPVDVIYRRVDDGFLDPLNFRRDSALGVPGLFDVFRAGRVTIVNAPGTGIADDKAMYSYMPDIIRFYTGDEPIIKNVPTWRCSDAKDLSYVLSNLENLVVKEVHGSGGYGMLIGPQSTKAKINEFRKRLISSPSRYVAQPVLSLSTSPIYKHGLLSPRHVDLRPFALVTGDSVTVTPGGLTRVALKKGSLVVNSSQGGGTKDTWVLET